MSDTEQNRGAVRKEKDEPADRRAARTRRLINEALMDLMHSRSFEQITVQDIIDKADIGRTTFYAHFKDKEDLATQFFEEKMEDLTKGIQPVSGKILVFPIAEMFAHLKEQNASHSAWLGSRGREFLFSIGQKYWFRRLEKELKAHTPKNHTPHVPVPIIAQILIGAATSLLHWWMSNKMPYSPEEMQEMYNRIVLPGVRLAIGKD